MGGDIRDSVRGGGGGSAALRMRTKRMEPRLPQLAPRRGQTLSGGGGLMGEINRSVEKMSIGDNSGGGGGSMMANQLGGGGGEGSSGMTALLSASGKLRGGGTGTVPPQSTLLQNTGSSR